MRQEHEIEDRHAEEVQEAEVEKIGPLPSCEVEIEKAEEEVVGVVGIEENERSKGLEEEEATSGEEKEPEDQVADTTLDDPVEDLAAICCGVNSTHTGTWQISDENSVPQVDELSPEFPEDTCSSAKEGRVVVVEPPLQIIGESYGNALKTRLQHCNGTRYQVREPSRARLMVQVRAGREWLAARRRMPVDRLWRVLDLRLQDEVLAKANRKISLRMLEGFVVLTVEHFGRFNEN